MRQGSGQRAHKEDIMTNELKKSCLINSNGKLNGVAYNKLVDFIRLAKLRVKLKERLGNMKRSQSR